MSDDPLLSQIQDRYKNFRYVNDLLNQLDFISKRQKRYLMVHAEKNGLLDICIKTAGGRLYCDVDKFVQWVDAGMQKQVG